MRQIRFLTEIAYNVKNVMEAKESFEQLNPDVQVVVEQAEDSFELFQAYKSEEAPDLIEMGGYPVGNRSGTFIDLNPYVAEIEGLEEDLFPGLLRVARHDGTLPGLPVEISPPLIMYNKEMFDQEGLMYPADDWFWDDMIGLAKRLTLRDESGLAKQFGFGIGIDIEWFEPFVMRNGGRYISPDGTTSRGYVDSPATIQAFRKIVEAFRLHRIIRLPDEPAETAKWPDEAAMNFAFAWDARHYRLKSGRYGVVGLPNMPGGEAANMIYMGGAGVTKKSANPRLAWEFLRHYLLERDSWMPPISKSQAEKRGLTAHPIWSRYLKELDHIQISGFFQNRKWNASRQLINEDIHR
ncbi:MAG: hypothetical protein K0R75_3459 [Paenibacillaceae bacterium]|nr:hypothetical protein [Paenibacillaceae bacterium]